MKIIDLFNFEKKSRIKAGEGLKEGEFPFYTSSQILSKKINTWQHSKPSIIFGTGGLPSIHFEDQKFSTSTDCIVLSKKIEIEINEKYPFYYLLCNIHIIERGFKGAGLKHISKKYIQEIDIPLTTIERQNEIVALLDKVKNLINKRNDAIVSLDKLLTAYFLDIFGEAPNNKKKWKVTNLNEKLDFITSGSRGWAKYYRDNGDIFLRINNLGYNKLLSEDLKYVDAPDSAEAIRTEVRPRDVLLSITADLGRTAVIPDKFPKAFINQHIAILRLKESINPYYLSAYISSTGGRHLLKRYSKGAAKSGLNFDDIKSLKLLIPPIDIQNTFEKIYLKIESQKKRLTSSKNELEELFKSIAQRAFSDQVNIDDEIALESLLDEIDLDKDKNDIRDIATAYLRELIEKINERDFEDLVQYRKAKKVAFQLLESGDLTQRYNKNYKRVEIVISQ